MLELLTLSNRPSTRRSLSNALVAHAFGDVQQVSVSAMLASYTAAMDNDHAGEGAALLLLGIARQDSTLIDGAIGVFERSFLYLDATIALCVRAAMERARGVALALLDKAQANLERAKRRLAQAGDVARWDAAQRLGRFIAQATKRSVDGAMWINGAPPPE